MSVPHHELVDSRDGDGRVLSKALAAALLACRDAMAQPTDHRNDRELVRSRIRLACEIAHEDDVPVEVLLIQMKRALRETPGIQDLSHLSRDEYQHDIVNFLVRAHYSD